MQPLSARIAWTGSAGAAHEQMAIEHGWLGVRRHVAFEAERPFECQPPDPIDRQPRLIGGLKAGVAGAGTPSVPSGRVRRDRHRGAGAKRRSAWCVDRVGRAEKGRHRPPLVKAHDEGDRHHGARIERTKNPGRRHFLQHLAMRDARGDLLMACRAPLLVDRVSRRWLCGERREGQAEKQKAKDQRRGHYSRLQGFRTLCARRRRRRSWNSPARKAFSRLRDRIEQLHRVQIGRDDAGRKPEPHVEVGADERAVVVDRQRRDVLEDSAARRRSETDTARRSTCRSS